MLEFTDFIATTTNADIKSYTTIKHSGDASCRAVATADGSAQAQQMFLATQVATDLYFRFYLYIVTAPTEDATIFNVWDRGVDALEGGLVLETDRQLHWIDDEGATDGQGTTVLSTGTWYRIEINYDAADQVLVYIDGVQEIDSSTHTGDSVDSLMIMLCDQDSGHTCGANGAQGQWLFDDIAVNDTSGTSQTGLPGNGSIVFMQPDSAGDSNGCSAGDYSSIDEITPDDATTICTLDLDTGGDVIDVNVESSATAGIGASDTITLTQVGIRDAAASAATKIWNMRIKSASGGTVTSGSNRSLSATTYRTNGGSTSAVGDYTLTSYLDPTTGVAWTPTGTNSLDNMQIGVNCSDCNPDTNVSTVWVLVEYVPAACDPAAQDCTQLFNAAGYSTWTVPTSVNEADFACWGGGAGGADGETNQGGGGGGGGAFASSTISVTAGSVYRIFVADVAAQETNGGTSTASTTAPAFVVEAQGGRALTAAVGAAGGLASASQGTTKYNGGTGGDGETGTGDESGGGGGAAGPHGAGAVGQVQQGTTGGAGGQGDNGSGGAGGAGGNATNGGTGTSDADGGGGGGGGDDGLSGGPGGAPGAGGGGGETGGGQGERGQCLITYRIVTVSVPTLTPVFNVNGVVNVNGTINVRR